MTGMPGPFPFDIFRACASDSFCVKKPFIFWRENFTAFFRFFPADVSDPLHFGPHLACRRPIYCYILRPAGLFFSKIEDPMLFHRIYHSIPI